MNEYEINAALASPELLTDICAEVSAGGTLAALCSTRGLPYRAANRWINDDLERVKRYKLALEIREEHAKDLIIAELVAYLRAQPADAFDLIDGHQSVREIADMPAELQRLIAGYEFEEIFRHEGHGKARQRVHVGRMHKVKFWDKPRAIETFMRHLSMLVEKKEINAKLSLADLIAGDL